MFQVERMGLKFFLSGICKKLPVAGATGAGSVYIIYAENIIVAIKSCGCIEWYILDKDYCFLDYPKLEEAYRKKRL